MAGEDSGVEARLLGGALDDPGDRAGGEALARDVAVAIDRSEHRADGDSRCFEPGVEGGDRACGAVLTVVNGCR